MSKKIIFSDETIKQIIEMYNVKEMSCVDIGNVFQVSETPIRRILHENNVKTINRKQFKRVESVNDSYFDIIDCEEKAYWLGFICADGFVYKNYVGICLSKTDEDHVVKFKNELNVTNKIYCRKKSQFEYSDLRFSSKHMVDKLKHIGVTENKTFILKIDEILKHIDDSFIHHFIRGYFDGDGTISRNSINGQPIFNIVLTEKNIDVMKKHLNIELRPIKDKRKKDSWYIQVQSRKKIIEIYNYLYRDATVFLQRKKDKFDFIVENIFN